MCNSGRGSASPRTPRRCLVDQHSSDANSPRLSPCCSASPSASRSNDGTSPQYAAIGSSRRNSAMTCSRWYARRTERSDTTRSSPIRRIRDSTDMPHEILRLSSAAMRIVRGSSGSIWARGVSSSAANSSASRSCCRSERPEEALAAVEEAIEIYRHLAQDLPDAFLHYLAGAPNNQSVHLANVGRREEALAASEKAVEIYRRLAHVIPDAFFSALATTVDNLADRLAALARNSEADAARRGGRGHSAGQRVSTDNFFVIAPPKQTRRPRRCEERNGTCSM